MLWKIPNVKMSLYHIQPRLLLGTPQCTFVLTTSEHTLAKVLPFLLSYGPRGSNSEMLRAIGWDQSSGFEKWLCPLMAV